MGKGHFGWFDSVTSDRVNRSLTFYPRMGEAVDIIEIIDGMTTVGFSIGKVSIRAEVVD